MEIKQWHFYLANLNPQKGTLTGKVRPVLVLQTNTLNNIHNSTIILPLTTKIVKNSEPLRVNIIPNEKNGIDIISDILIDQIIAIDNKRFIKELGKIDNNLISIVKEYTLHVLGW